MIPENNGNEQQDNILQTIEIWTGFACIVAAAYSWELLPLIGAAILWWDASHDAMIANDIANALRGSKQ